MSPRQILELPNHNRNHLRKRKSHAIFRTPGLEFVPHRLARRHSDSITTPRSGELLLWRFHSEWQIISAQKGEDWLSNMERECAKRHPNSALRKRFTVSRVVLRWILSKLFDCAPALVPLREDNQGRLCVLDTRDGRNIAIDIAYAGIWIVIGISACPLGLGIALPKPARGLPSTLESNISASLVSNEASTQSFSDEDMTDIQREARRASLLNVIDHQIDYIAPVVLEYKEIYQLVDLSNAGRWHLLDLPMPGKISASAAVTQQITQIHAFGWAKV